MCIIRKRKASQPAGGKRHCLRLSEALHNASQRPWGRLAQSIATGRVRGQQMGKHLTQTPPGGCFFSSGAQMLCSCQRKQGDASRCSWEPQWGQRGSKLREEARSGLRSQSHHLSYGPIVDKWARRSGRASSGPLLSDRGVIVTHEFWGNASQITSFCCTAICKAHWEAPWKAPM